MSCENFIKYVFLSCRSRNLRIFNPNCRWAIKVAKCVSKTDGVLPAIVIA